MLDTVLGVTGLVNLTDQAIFNKIVHRNAEMRRAPPAGLPEGLGQCLGLAFPGWFQPAMAWTLLMRGASRPIRPRKRSATGTGL